MKENNPRAPNGYQSRGAVAPSLFGYYYLGEMIYLIPFFCVIGALTSTDISFFR